MSTVFRVEKSSNYTVMSNFHMMDYTLSYKAKGILSEILSLPPTWDYTLAGLAALANDGIDSVRSGIKELENSGYCYIPFQSNNLQMPDNTLPQPVLKR